MVPWVGLESKRWHMRCWVQQLSLGQYGQYGQPGGLGNVGISSSTIIGVSKGKAGVVAEEAGKPSFGCHQ